MRFAGALCICRNATVTRPAAAQVVSIDVQNSTFTASGNQSSVLVAHQADSSSHKNGTMVLTVTGSTFVGGRRPLWARRGAATTRITDCTFTGLTRGSALVLEQPTDRAELTRVQFLGNNISTSDDPLVRIDVAGATFADGITPRVTTSLSSCTFERNTVSTHLGLVAFTDTTKRWADQLNAWTPPPLPAPGSFNIPTAEDGDAIPLSISMTNLVLTQNANLFRLGATNATIARYNYTSLLRFDGPNSTTTITVLNATANTGSVIYFSVPGSSVTLTRCTFVNNTLPSGLVGAAAVTMIQPSNVNCGGLGGVTANECRFEGNTGTLSGAVWQVGGDTAVYRSCNFTGNTATLGELPEGFDLNFQPVLPGGGAVGVLVPSRLGGFAARPALVTLSMTQCRLIGNRAPSRGGALYAAGATVQVRCCLRSAAVVHTCKCVGA